MYSLTLAKILALSELTRETNYLRNYWHWHMLCTFDHDWMWTCVAGESRDEMTTERNKDQHQQQQTNNLDQTDDVTTCMYPHHLTLTATTLTYTQHEYATKLWTESGCPYINLYSPTSGRIEKRISRNINANNKRKYNRQYNTWALHFYDKIVSLSLLK